MNLLSKRSLFYSLFFAGYFAGYLFISPALLFADTVNGLIVWALKDKGTKIILPQIEGKKPAETVSRYLEAFNRSEAYKTLLKEYQDTDQQEKGKFTAETKEIKPYIKPSTLSNSDPVPIAVIANRPGHMSLNDPFFVNVHQGIRAGGGDVYIVPLGLETMLSHNELREYHEQVAKNFPGMMSIGGGDLDPAQYKEKNICSKNILPQRDRSELDLIRTYSHEKNGAMYGICRGHQAYSVAMGGKLLQNLSQTVTRHSLNAHDAHDGSLVSAWHTIEISDSKNALYELFVKDLDARLRVLRNKREGSVKILVNSRHHQAVQENPPGSAIVAVEGDAGHGKVVEAIETRDRNGKVRALTLQFHPEDIGLVGGGTAETEETGKKILKWMVDNARTFMQPKLSRSSISASPAQANQPDFVYANGIPITGNETYPLEFVLSNLKIDKTDLSQYKDKNVLTVAEGFSDFLPYFIQNGSQQNTEIKALDTWYGQKEYPQNDIGKKMAEFSQKYKAHLIAGSAFDMPIEPNSQDFVFSHQFVNHILEKQKVNTFLDQTYAILKPKGEARIFGFQNLSDLKEHEKALIKKHGRQIRVSHELLKTPIKTKNLEYTLSGYLLTVEKI
jgi:gamma-glutamyl-gamma-aminobutyrate hydrolase PuuD/ubiquinone/menaquinone biosynthesis C-methylase UbiE